MIFGHECYYSCLKFCHLFVTNACLAVAKPSRGSERFLMLRAAEDRNGRYQLRAE